MSKVKPTGKILDEVLSRQLQLPAWDAEKAGSIRAEFSAKKRQELNPLVNLAAAIEKLVPGFIINMLAKQEEKSGEHHDITEAELTRLKTKHDAEYGDQLADRDFLIDMLNEAAEFEESTHQLIEAQDLPLIRELYDQVVLFNLFSDESLVFIYRRLANSAKKIPGFILAALAQMALTPFICAKVTEHLNPDEAGKLARNFRPQFLAETSVHTPPEVTAPIAAYVSDKTLTQVVDVLQQHGHFHNLAGINDLLDRSISDNLSSGLKSPDNIAKILSYMTNLDRIGEMRSLYPPTMVDQIVERLEKLDNEKAKIFKG